MTADFDQIRQVAEATEVIRAPRQSLATFGVTTVRYFVVTEPAYQEFAPDSTEAVIRTGQVQSERPRLVTPFYLGNRFRGFPHGEEFARYLASVFGTDAPGLFYAYSQTEGDVEIVHESAPVVARRLADQLDAEGDHLAVVILGVDAYWDLSLLKFIHDYTVASAGRNLADFNRRGLLGVDRGVPREARQRIEELFEQVAARTLDPSELHAELVRWDLFAEYEDRFLQLFSRS